MPYEEICLEADEKMDKAVDLLKEELRTIRSGRASAGLVEHIRVDYYGTMTPIREIASIGTPEPRLIVIRPYDPNSAGEIEKAILKSDLGIAPANDGKLIRIAVPVLSEERRKQIATKIKKLGEETKIAIRNIRRDANKQIDREKKDGTMTEDDAFGTKDDIQEMTEKAESGVDEAIQAKSDEIMEV